jgi:anthraniloyl-CoA monooxygenase
LHLAADQHAHRRIRRLVANRLRYPLEARDARGVAGAQADVSAHRHRPGRGGITGADAVVSRARSAKPASIWSMSSTGRAGRAADLRRMFQTPFSDQVRNEARVATMCVGNITTAIRSTPFGRRPRRPVALARPHLVDPGFTMRAAAWYGADIACPPQYPENRSSATACATGRISRTSD